MFGLSFAEILIILLVVLLFFRPKDYPRLFSKFGRLYGQIVRQVGAAKRLITEYEDEEQRSGKAGQSRDNDSEEQ